MAASCLQTPTVSLSSTHLSFSSPAPSIPTLGPAQGLSLVTYGVESSDTNNCQKEKKKKNPTCEEIHFNIKKINLN